MFGLPHLCASKSEWPQLREGTKGSGLCSLGAASISHWNYPNKSLISISGGIQNILTQIHPAMNHADICLYAVMSGGRTKLKRAKSGLQLMKCTFTLLIPNGKSYFN